MQSILVQSNVNSKCIPVCSSLFFMNIQYFARRWTEQQRDWNLLSRNSIRYWPIQTKWLGFSDEKPSQSFRQEFPKMSTNTLLNRSDKAHSVSRLRFDRSVYKLLNAQGVESWRQNAILMRKKLDYLHLEDFLNYECEAYSMQPLSPPQLRKIMAGYRTSNQRLANETGRWPIIQSLEITEYANFAQVVISHYLIEGTALTPPWCTSSTIRYVGLTQIFYLNPTPLIKWCIVTSDLRTDT